MTEKNQHASITVYKYNAETFQKSEVETVSEIESNFCYWIHVKGLKNEALIHSLSQRFGIHPLMTEDILHTVQRPKIDELEDGIFLVLKMYYVRQTIHSQQVSFFVKDNFIISFEEHQTDALLLVEKKLEENRLSIRKRGEDYLLFSLLDVVIDNYFDTEEYIYREIEKIEKPLNAHPQKQQLLRLIQWRKELLLIKRTIAPISDIMHALTRANYSFFQKENKLFFRDLHDHILRVLDTFDMHREAANSLVETYHAQVNNKMNEVMKTLTIMSSVFIPLTFIAGIYGMNFDNMPELRMHFGYFVTLGAMAVIAVALLIYFKRKKYF